MKNIDELLKAKMEEQQKIVEKLNQNTDQTNQLKQDRQNLLQEAFKLEGAIKTLNELKGESKSK